MKLFRTLALACSVAWLVGCGADAESDLGVTGESEGALTIRGFEEPSADQKASSLSQHANVDPDGVVPRDLLGSALGFFDLNRDRLDNAHYVTVVDFAKHSRHERFFIVDLETGSVESHVVAHGSGSDPGNTGIATRFSNVPDSEASSLGYYVTGETYQGKHGFSLRLDGVSDTNSNVRDRDVVVHGADYVSPDRSKQGRSWGCLALPVDEASSVIRKLRGGSVIYAERSGRTDG